MTQASSVNLRRAAWLACALAAGALLAACAEREQTISQGVKTDTPAFQGTGKAFVAAGWKQGDRGSWEQELKTRTQMGQNDYNKVP